MPDSLANHIVALVKVFLERHVPVEIQIRALKDFLATKDLDKLLPREGHETTYTLYMNQLVSFKARSGQNLSTDTDEVAKLLRPWLEELSGTLGERDYAKESTHPIPEGLLNLLKRAILSPGDKTLLQQVQQHADAIINALEEDEGEFSAEDIKRLELHPEWTAAVYRALAGLQEVSDEDHEIVEAIQQIRGSEDAEIGRVFAEALEALPEEFHQWDQWFDHVPLVPEDYQTHLSEQIIVISGMPYAAGLIQYGMTPGTFLEGSRGVELLANRLIRTALSPDLPYPQQPELMPLYRWIRERDSDTLPSVDLVLQEQSALQGERPVIPYGLLVAQVRGTPNCPLEAAEPLLHWMVEVAQLRPYFFAGYHATTIGPKEIRLTKDSRIDDEVAWRKAYAGLAVSRTKDSRYTDAELAWRLAWRWTRGTLMPNWPGAGVRPRR
jgi:hypothetical protein